MQIGNFWFSKLILDLLRGMTGIQIIDEKTEKLINNCGIRFVYFAVVQYSSRKK